MMNVEKKRVIVYNRFGDNMNAKKIKRIAYGVTDYEKIVLDYSYYVDKTKYLKSIEEVGDYLFFIRPRRFGKTLFLSTMETYYDILKKDRFDLFYKGTQIHQNPTDERNSYLILKFNFSAVDPYPERIEASFLNNVRNVVETFTHKYEGYLETRDRERLQDKLEHTRSAADVLANVVNLSRKSNMKIYIIIDEYDNFANTILSTSGSAAYENLTHGEGFFRAFFNFLKEGTSGSGAPISRLFITGVSPLTLDDITSGFNIGKNISIEMDFNEMLGFTETDVIEMIDYYRQNGLIDHPTEYLVDIMKDWYNNYIFSKDSKTTLFNSDMVLYFIDKYIRHSKIPDNLVDRNVRIDYGKLRHLIIIDSDRKALTNSNFSRLKQIIEESEIESELVEGFPVDKLIHAENFISLLFYFGLLTIKGVSEEDEATVLQVPNETARRLYYDYIKEAYEETDIFSMDLYDYGQLMRGMAYRGEWKALFEYIAQRMKASMSLRDLITGEKSVQAFLNVYLGLSQLYIIHSEKELNEGFADIVMEPFTARYRGMKYAYILEIKYIKKEDKDKNLELKIKDAEEQLKKYTLDEKLQKAVSGTTLVKLVLVFSGTELKYIGELRD
jgi:hypothetical protein